MQSGNEIIYFFFSYYNIMYRVMRIVICKSGYICTIGEIFTTEYAIMCKISKKLQLKSTNGLRVGWNDTIISSCFWQFFLYKFCIFLMHFIFYLINYFINFNFYAYKYRLCQNFWNCDCKISMKSNVISLLNYYRKFRVTFCVYCTLRFKNSFISSFVIKFKDCIKFTRED